ncbi:hypothetical protein JCM11641_001142 [Rhodosporidiobolus odoratus]
MFAYPTQAYYPQPTLDDFFSSSYATVPHSHPVDYLSLLAARQEQEKLEQTRHRQAELVAYLESEHLRRRRQLALQRALQEEQERLRLEYEVQQALAYRAALVRRAQEEAEARRQRQLALSATMARRRAAVEQARRRAVVVAAEGGKRRRNLEASRQCQALESCPAAFLQQLFGLHDASEVGQHEHVNPPAVATAPSPANKFPPSCLSSAKPISPAVEAPADPACFLQLLFSLGGCDEAQPDQVKKPEVAAPTLQQSLPSVVHTKPPAPPSEASSDASSDSSALSDAASVLQRHFRRHLARRNALSALHTLSSDFESHQSAFSAPSTLTFQPSHPATPAADVLRPSTPSLAFGKPNTPFLEYENFLVQLLSKIDEVQSGGDRFVKKARKELVKKVEAELGRLDGMKERAWEEQSQSEEEVAKEVTPETPAEEIPAAKTTHASEPSADIHSLSPSLSTATMDSLHILPADASAPTLPTNSSSPTAATPRAQSATDRSPSYPLVPSQSATQSEDFVISTARPTAPGATTLSAFAASPTADPSPPKSATTAVKPPSRPSSRASTLSASSDGSSQVDTAVQEILKRAAELGDEVRRLEEAETDALDQVVTATPATNNEAATDNNPVCAAAYHGDVTAGENSAKKEADEREDISDAETEGFEVV